MDNWTAENPVMNHEKYFMVCLSCEIVYGRE
jgi:hypothetical protein